MALLLVGLFLFIGVHCIRPFAPDLRESMIEQLGARNWKLLYSAVAIVGLLTTIMGYGYARYSAVWLWTPPVWSRHVAAILILVAFIYLAVAKMPYSKMKQMGGHPMLIGVKLWAFAHLISNGSSADVVLFGAFLAWAVADYAISKRRDREAGVTYEAPNMKYDLIAVVIGTVAFALFAFYLHPILIGVAPFAI